MSKPEITDAEAQQKIAAMFETLNEVYLLHAPDQEVTPWTCKECNGTEWPCKTAKIVLDGLGL